MAGQSARSAAQGLADHFNGVLNRTVSDSRLTVVSHPDHDDQFHLTRLVDRRRVPLELRATSLRLFVTQAIRVVDGHCRTVSYSYRLQTGEETDTWLLRWEYFRQPPKPEYMYVLGHVHFNGDFVGCAADPHFEKSPDHLHIPTGRVALELVIWHLVSEWAVQPVTDGWQAILSDSLEGFHERRTAN